MNSKLTAAPASRMSLTFGVFQQGRHEKLGRASFFFFHSPMFSSEEQGLTRLLCCDSAKRAKEWTLLCWRWLTRPEAPSAAFGFVKPLSPLTPAACHLFCNVLPLYSLWASTQLPNVGPHKRKPWPCLQGLDVDNFFMAGYCDRGLRWSAVILCESGKVRWSSNWKEKGIKEQSGKPCVRPSTYCTSSMVEQSCTQGLLVALKFWDFVIVFQVFGWH